MIPSKTNLQLLNMNLGFLGIQFGWSLQMANMSAIYENLGATPEQIPGLWLAAPLTGLIVQPIIGYLSDRTWGPLGRRRPYFLVGAILSTLALIAMPYASTLAAAATLLWVLDASINVSMEPFRAFVADVLPIEQRSQGFATQSLLIGLGAVIAYALPYLLSNLGLPATGAHLPPNVTWAFNLGALAFITTVIWTVCTTPEYPPQPQPQQKEQPAKFPPILLKLAPIQILTWLGLFCMWIYFPVTVAHHVFPADQYQQGVDWGGVCFACYSLVTFLFAPLLPTLSRKYTEGTTHGLCLLTGGLGLLSVAFIHHKFLLLLPMVAVGIAWASILSLPYTLLSRQLKATNTGLWMGLFNACIVVPEICVALGFGWVMHNLLSNNRLAAVCLGGACLLLAGLLSLILLKKEQPCAD